MSDSEHEGKTELITGIEKDAQSEADTLVSQANQYVAERMTACESKLLEIRKEADEKLAKQVLEIRKSFQSTATVEKRRLALKVREKIIGEISLKVKAHLASLVGKTGYTAILAGWILEAAIGLNTKEAAVNASQKEKALLDQKLLSGIEKRVQELAGRSIRLHLSAEDPLSAQGVVLTSMDKRTAFNNQVQTRLLRYQSEIRKMIYDTLFKD